MKRFLTILSAVVLLCMLPGCHAKNEDTKTIDLTAFPNPSGYALKAPAVTTKSYEDFEKSIREVDAVSACSAVTWTTDQGSVAQLRNMDSRYSKKPAVAYYFDVKGSYKSWNVAYLLNNIQTYEEVMAAGFTKEALDWYTSVPTDVFNEKGLYAEMQTRSIDLDIEKMDPKWLSDKGSNPSAKETRHILTFGREIANHCATVEEAKEYAGTINWMSEAYTPYYYAWLVNDGKDTALFELIDNKLNVTAGVKVHTNTLIAKPYADESLFDIGAGRTEHFSYNFQDGLPFMDGFEIMMGLQYTNMYSPISPYEVASDFESQMIDTNGDGKADTWITKNNKDTPAVQNFIKKEIEKFKSKDNMQRMEEEVAMHTAYSIGIDWANPTQMRVQFMENRSMTYIFDVSDGTFKLAEDI